jgi:aldehyde dehydrogenase (NAD+)
MENNRRFYINGEWVDPINSVPFEVINPATEEAIGAISLGSAADVDHAVAAARAALPGYSQTSKRERIAMLRRIIEVYRTRFSEIVQTISMEMGSPLWFSREIQAATALDHFAQAIEVLDTYDFEFLQGRTLISREPIGVCGFITPWNWPIQQIVCKLAPALAAGCTVVVKPSELAPLSPLILAEVMHAAGVPKGVFNLVNGDGPTVGQRIAGHPDIDLVSITGSTRAGILVAKAAADSVKRVHQELGGKSANIVLPDADLKTAVPAGVKRSFFNSGQSCQGPTRMLVQAQQYDTAVNLAEAAARSVKVGDPSSDDTNIGPVASAAQFEKIQRMIDVGLKEGATLVVGGPGRPEGFNRGYYVRPTVFADVRPEMTIAREEIFGPVLCMLPYETEEDAVAIANDTPYGLAAYVQSSDLARARRVASQMRAGRVYLNGFHVDVAAPFGGYKQSGNGREWGRFGFEEFLEVKAVLGYQPA